MSGIMTSTTIALTTVATVFAAAFPEVSQAIAPVFDTANEYTAYALGLMVTIPGIALLTLVAGAAND